MSTPYWGQLPPSQARRLSESSDLADRRQSLDQPSLSQSPHDSLSHRASEKTAAARALAGSISTPLVSLTTANAPSTGHARRSSLSYTRNQYLPEAVETRRTRTSRDQSDETCELTHSPPPPAAPDVPKAPPVSYKHPFGSGASSYPYRSAGQLGSPRLSYQPEPLEKALDMEPESFYKEPTPPAERQSRQPTLDRAYQNFNNGVVSPEHLERELLRSGSIRRPSNGYRPDPRDPTSPASPTRRESLGPESQQKMWAADRSPLQKLELTLDSITKEEKRARVEAAERRARERAARVSESARTVGYDKPSSGPRSDQQARHKSKNESVGGEQSHAVIADPVQAMPSATAARGASSKNPQEADQQLRYPGQSPRSSRIPVPTNPSTSAPIGGIPQRNLSFRERAATHERGLSHEPYDEAPQVAQATESGANFVPARSGSNKLKKNPPGDPWYTVRREAEERSAERSAAYNRLSSGDGNDQETQPPYRGSNYIAGRSGGGMTQGIPTSIEDPPRPPARGKTFGEDRYEEEERPRGIRGLAAAIGFGRSNSIGSNRRTSLPNPKRNEPQTVPILRGQYTQPNSLEGPVDREHEFATTVRPTQPNKISQNRQALSPARGFQGTQTSERGTKSVKFQDKEHGSDTFDETMSDSTHHKHRLREYLHHEGLKPGQGTYRAPIFLDEWKQGTTGILSGPLLDLSLDPIEPLDKNTPWWEAHGKRRSSSFTQSPKRAFDSGNDDGQTRTSFVPPLYLKCGPLLRYRGMRVEPSTARMSHDNLAVENEFWRGSVMIVTQDSASSHDTVPILRLFVQPIELLPPPPAEIRGGQPLPPEYVDPIAGIPKIGRQGETLYVRLVDQLEEAKDLSMVEPDDGLFELTRTPPDDDVEAPDPPGSFPDRKKRMEVDGEKLGKFKEVQGVRLHAEHGHTFWRFNIEVELRDKQQRIAYRINRGPATGFWVPARGESMNIMFYSCNGFSHNVNPDEFSGPDPMWRDVLNVHQTRPFHVMIGGGDQVYNDAVTNNAKLFREWLGIKNPLHKSNAPFTAAMQEELEVFYLERYMMWFSQGLFGLANSQIPMVNMFDDHDIIDGFGSYSHHFMKSPVFSGLGNVAFKYYMLFQHQTVPDETEASEPSWCLGVKPGPYIHSLSRSLFVSLGSRVALLAVDARTERTRDEVVHPDTWRKLMDRCYDEIVKGTTKHLLVLLGVPIAYPRLVWLENILTSRIMDPIKALGKFGLLGNFVNSFDGGVEVLDDLDDHWTAKDHKEERRFVIEDLQDLAVDKSVRVTILSGDVHLAAVGQFYSNPKLKIPKHKDFRYMLNVISSAIANAPPPDLMADVLNKRNKIHHFDKETDESMMPLFAHGVDSKPRNNKHLLPHRNWCSIREYVPGHTPPPTPPSEELEYTPEVTPPGSRGSILRRLSLSKKRGPALRPDVPKSPTDRSRPPLSGGSGGFMRSFSRRGSSSEEVGRPGSSGLFRTLSLGSRPRNLLRRGSRKGRPDDGGINGSWGDDDEDIFAAPAQTPPARNPPAHNPPTQKPATRTTSAKKSPTRSHSSRWAEFDTDAERLPHGMQRTGYDADTQSYTFRDTDGSCWESAPGNRYGRLQRISGPTSGLRGGGGSEFEIGDEAQFTARSPRRAFTQPIQSTAMQHQQNYSDGDVGGLPIKPFHRTPTGLSVKKLRKHGPEHYEIDTEGSLEVCLNVEVNPKDPAGITVPYRLLVPRLWYEYQGESPEPEPEEPSSVDEQQRRHSRQGGPGYMEDEQYDDEEIPQKKVGGLRRFFSGRGTRDQRRYVEEGEEDEGEM